MADVFLYGTLRHAGLLEVVLGVFPEGRLQEARLEGYQVSRARGHGFPLIAAQAGAVAYGLLLTGVSAEERARLDHYELGFGYHLQDVKVGQRDALVYLPEPGLWEAAEPWSLEAWTATDWPRVKHSAREIMGYMGRDDLTNLAWHFPTINARAHSKALAETTPASTEVKTQTSANDVEVLSHEVSHLGFFRTDVYKLRYPRYDGSISAPIHREVFLGADAALVLPYDPVRQTVMLVEQFRMGPFARGDKTPWVLEPIAGRLDAGETAEEAARRECFEEAGLTLQSLHPMAGGYASPGEVSTYFHMFIGIADLPFGQAGLGGLDGEHEDIKSHVLSLEAALALVDSGEINVGPLIQMLYWLALHKTGLGSVG